jgi:cellulose synthase/poly-beta-1,6-N-acetylglucosamine synthase-like glycosyltransferase
VTEAVFWISLFGLFYIYAGYPLLVRGLARLFPLRRTISEITSLDPTDPVSRVSVVIASSNDGEVLRAKIVQLLNSPQADFIHEILIGSDGSTDNTAELVRGIGDCRIRLFEFNERRGKPAVLNCLLPECQSEIVVLCDARQILSDEAIPAMLANFADPQVGVVSGELVFRAESLEGSTAARGIGAYWRYEKSIRKAEARFRSVPGATGALYAIRKDLFSRIPDSTLLDDVVIPMQTITQGYRCVFEPRAIAWDTPSETLGRESVRKRRTIAGAAQLITMHPSWLLPWKNPIWLEFVSHKLLRLASPFLLLVVLAANYQLASTNLFYSVLQVLHVAFYYSAVAGWMCQRIGQPSVLFGLQLTFMTLNLTTLAALWDAVRGRFRVTWQRS